MVGSWLITGGCGFLGTTLVARILAETPKARIVVYDNLSVGTEQSLGEVCSFTVREPAEAAEAPGVSLVRGDIRDYESLRQATQGARCVVHLAASTGVGPSVEDPRFDLESNVVGTFNSLEAARAAGADKYVFASSGAPAGEVEPPIHEEMAPHPVSPYGASKLAGEGYCSAFARTFGLKTVTLRFGNVYGPRSGHKTSVIATFIRQALAGETCVIHGDGTQTRDFIHIEDLMDAMMASVRADVGGETFQIASSLERTVNEIAEIIREELKDMLGVQMNIEHDSPRTGDVMRNYSDTSKARRMLGWEARRPLREGIRETIRNFAAHRGEGV